MGLYPIGYSSTQGMDMKEYKYYLGLDIGGTKCALSVGKATEDEIEVIEGDPRIVERKRSKEKHIPRKR